MKVTAVKTFRARGRQGEIVHRGDTIEVDESYGADLIRTEMAVSSAKALKEHENKMLEDFADKGMPVESESPEQRSGGYVGPTKDSETPEQRNQGTVTGKKR